MSVRAPCGDRAGSEWEKAVLDVRVDGSCGGPVQYLDVVVGHPVGLDDDAVAGQEDEDDNDADDAMSSDCDDLKSSIAALKQ